jgi:hypothetical protein
VEAEIARVGRLERLVEPPVLLRGGLQLRGQDGALDRALDDAVEEHDGQRIRLRAGAGGAGIP